MKPGAEIVVKREKDRILSSIFHNRTSPSHDPDAKTSPYGRVAREVIQRGVPMMPSVSETCSLNP